MTQANHMSTSTLSWSHLNVATGVENAPGSTSINVGRAHDGVDDALFRYKLRNGIACVNSFTAQRCKLNAYAPQIAEFYELAAPYDLLFVSHGYRNGTFGNLSAPSAGSFDTPYQQALAAFNKRLVGASKAFNGGTFLGELRETLTMLRNPGKALRTGVDRYLRAAYPLAKKARKASTRSARRNAEKSIAGSYLEAVFGWAPLVHDIYDAGVAVNSLRHFGLIRVSAVGRQLSATSTMHNTTSGAGNTMYYHKVTRRLYDVRFFGAVRVEPRTVAQANLDRWGLNPLRDFVPTAWELLPWSWAIDYFSNISDIMASWSTLFARKAWVGVTKRSIQRLYSYEIATKSSAHRTAQVSKQAVMVERKDVLRSVPTTLVPDFQVEIPGFGDRKWCNLAAVASQFRN